MDSRKQADSSTSGRTTDRQETGRHQSPSSSQSVTDEPVTPEVLVRMWNIAAPWQFAYKGATHRGNGEIRVDVLRPLNKGKKEVIKVGASLIGYAVTITDKEIIFKKLDAPPKYVGRVR